jgi:hypothetical protein
LPIVIHLRLRRRDHQHERERGKPDRQVGQRPRQRDGEVLRARVRHPAEMDEAAEHVDVDPVGRHAVAARHRRVCDLVQQDRHEDDRDEQHREQQASGVEPVPERRCKNDRGNEERRVEKDRRALVMAEVERPIPHRKSDCHAPPPYRSSAPDGLTFNVRRAH